MCPLCTRSNHLLGRIGVVESGLAYPTRTAIIVTIFAVCRMIDPYSTPPLLDAIPYCRHRYLAQADDPIDFSTFVDLLDEKDTSMQIFFENALKKANQRRRRQRDQMRYAVAWTDA